MNNAEIYELIGNLYGKAAGQWAQRRLNVVSNNAITTAAVNLNASGYSLLVCPDYWDNLTIEAKKATIRHELLHIFRGDCIHQRRVLDYYKDKNKALVNQACNKAYDAHVHYMLGEDEVQSLADAIKNIYGGQIVTWSNLAKEIGANPKQHIYGEMQIIEKLINQDNDDMHGPNESEDNEHDSGQSTSASGKSENNQDKENNDSDAQSENDNAQSQNEKQSNNEGKNDALNNDVFPAEGNLSECVKRHLESILDAPRDLSNFSQSAGIARNTNPTRTIPQAKRHPKICQVLSYLVPRIAPRNAGGTRIVSNTWRRPHRQDIDYLPGRGKTPRAKIIVAVDISGSMAALWNDILAYSSALKKDFDVEVIVWADSAAIVKGNGIPPVGTGTEMIPMLSLAKSLRPDLLVVISDMDIADYPADRPNCKIVWATSMSKPPQQLVKESDIVIDIREKQQ